MNFIIVLPLLRSGAKLENNKTKVISKQIKMLN